MVIKQHIIENKEKNDVIINAIKDSKTHGNKKRLFLDVDGTLIAMQFNPNWKEGAIWPYNNVIHRTDFCHFINSIYSVLDKMCEVYVLTNYTVESEKVNKINWLNENLKCKHIAILNKEGITKSLYVNNENDILVDDTFRNLAEWSSAGGTFFAAQYVCCEKGRRELLEIIVGK